MQETLERVRAGEDDPPCRQCNGMLKSDTISFGQPLVPEVIQHALTAAQQDRRSALDRNKSAGLSDRERGSLREGRRRARGHHECAADAIRWNRRRGPQRLDQRHPSSALSPMRS